MFLNEKGSVSSQTRKSDDVTTHGGGEIHTLKKNGNVTVVSIQLARNYDRHVQLRDHFSQ